MTCWAFSENAVPGGGSVGIWLAILVISKINTNTAAKMAIFFMTGRLSERRQRPGRPLARWRTGVTPASRRKPLCSQSSSRPQAKQEQSRSRKAGIPRLGTALRQFLILIFAPVQRRLVVVGSRRARAAGARSARTAGRISAPGAGPPQRRFLRVLRVGQAALVFNSSQPCLDVVELRGRHRVLIPSGQNARNLLLRVQNPVWRLRIGRAHV